MDTIEVTECQDSNERSESDECPICWSKFDNKCNTNGCGHEFCLNCLLEWLQQQPYCPVCRQSFSIIRHSFRSVDDFDIISSKLLELKKQMVNGIQAEGHRLERLQQRMAEAVERQTRRVEALERLSNIHENSEQNISETIDAIVSEYEQVFGLWNNALSDYYSSDEDSSGYYSDISGESLSGFFAATDESSWIYDGFQPLLAPDAHLMNGEATDEDINDMHPPQHHHLNQD